MGTKKTTTTNSSTANTYAPGAMQGYQTALNTAKGLVSNPYGNPFYQQTYTQGMNAANQINQGLMQNLAATIARNGLANSPAGGMLANMNSYMASHNRMNAFLGAANQAQSMFGAGMNMLANPLVTGANSNSVQTQKTSGLGTWLPQVAAMGVGAFTGGMGGGGLMGAMKGAMGMPSGGNQMGGNMGSMGMQTPTYMPSSYSPFANSQTVGMIPGVSSPWTVS